MKNSTGSTGNESCCKGFRSQEQRCLDSLLPLYIQRGITCLDKTIIWPSFILNSEFTESNPGVQCRLKYLSVSESITYRDFIQASEIEDSATDMSNPNNIRSITERKRIPAPPFSVEC